MSFSEIVQSAGWKNFMAKLYGIGASIVILGALFKIQHWPFAGIMLTVGLTTEAIIFFFSAFEPTHEEYDWTLVYPELAGMGEDFDDDQEASPQPRQRSVGSYTHGGGGYAPPAAGSSSALARFDEMVQNAEISPEMFEKLGKGLQNLNATTEKLSDISDAAAATNEYVSNVKKAASSVDSLSETFNQTSGNLRQSSEAFQNTTNELLRSYNQLSESVTSENETISEGNKSIGEKLGHINKNLAALNAVYELQLQSNNEHMKSSQEVYKDLGNVTNNLKTSVEETDKYREEISKLSRNLSDLNSIYGNMLSAMSMVNKPK